MYGLISIVGAWEDLYLLFDIMEYHLGGIKTSIFLAFFNLFEWNISYKKDAECKNISIFYCF